MSIEITMPRLSDTMEMGTVIKWNVKEGDAVAPGDVLADIETDKATMELQAFDEGAVAKILVREGQSMAVGSTILVLAEDGEDPASIEVSGGGAAASTPQEKSATEPSLRSDSASGAPAPAPSTNGRIAASPLARKIAGESGIDLGSIRGTGPGGRIVRKDVEAAIRGGGAAPASSVSEPSLRSDSASRMASPAPAPVAPMATLEARDVELSNMRRTIARRLVESKTSIPHYQVTVKVNMDPLLTLRAQLNEQLSAQGVKLSVNDFLVRACALALHAHPYVNASWVGSQGSEKIRINGQVNIGVAVALAEERGGGLVVASLRGADAMGLRQISSETKRLAIKAREKGLTVEEMEGATFTISNLGMFGVEHFTAIINPPNSAILAVGAAVEQPVVRDGQIVVGHEMQMTMSSDHRVIDGAMAAKFLADVREALEHPATLLV
ncbi:MAG: 2-oxo acid dehydrogenase subunit E2 [Phycisphaeraceae bacterium]|nr:2-oxo acid dehydrogenase subunit E2 [Phycisphaeraceae bacterium]